MGTGKAFSLHEIDDTRAAGADDKFEEIIEKIKAAGGEIIEDETHPLYDEIGMEEAEVGEEREVKFNLNKMDFKILRRKETFRITGAGRNKSLEPMSPPRVSITMKRKPEISSDWIVVDLDDMF